MNNPIREEIKKLQRYWGDHILAGDIYTILDKYEVVVDIVCEESKLNLEIFGRPVVRLMREARAGDHIIILREKGVSGE